MEKELFEILGSGGVIGGGALGGAYLLTSIMKFYLGDIKQEVKRLADSIEVLLRNHEVTKTKLELEILHIRSRLEEIEKRIDRCELIKKGD